MSDGWKYLGITGAFAVLFWIVYLEEHYGYYTGTKNPMISLTFSRISFVSKLLCSTAACDVGGGKVEVTTKYRSICGAIVDCLPGRTLRVLYGY